MAMASYRCIGTGSLPAIGVMVIVTMPFSLVIPIEKVGETIPEIRANADIAEYRSCDEIRRWATSPNDWNGWRGLVRPIAVSSVSLTASAQSREKRSQVYERSCCLEPLRSTPALCSNASESKPRLAKTALTDWNPATFERENDFMRLGHVALQQKVKRLTMHRFIPFQGKHGIGALSRAARGGDITRRDQFDCFNQLD